MKQLRTRIARVAPTNLAVLIQGPTGAGKELVARALHAASGRRGRLVPFNVCAIADTMFEDDLFGHVRGAFTGAIDDKPGYLAEAHGGTVFLDEIGGLALPAQAKLLRAIETGTFRPVGAREDRTSDFRVVAAANEPLDDLVRAGRFRPDLAQRLSGIIVDVAPLSERLEDIPALVCHFGDSHRNGAAGLRLTAGALRALQRHDWPGNVRELMHVIERAVALSGRRTLRRDDVRAALGQEEARSATNAAPRPAGGAAVAPDADPLEPARRELIEVLEVCEWDTARAAIRLGVHRATVYRRMQGLGITRPRATVNGRRGRGRAARRNPGNGHG